MKFKLTFLSLFLALTLNATHGRATSPLRPILEKIANARGEYPTLVMDLDETTIDSTPRAVAAYQAAIYSMKRDGLILDTDPDYKKISAMTENSVYSLSNRYDHEALMQEIGFQNSVLSAELSKRKLGIYLSGKFIEKDKAWPGMRTFFEKAKLANPNLQVFFVSSRFDDVQRKGTLLSLKKLGFLKEGQEDHLILRARNQDSLSFKKEAFAKLKEMSEDRQPPFAFIGVFENEPENLNAMIEAFPNATSVFVRGAFIKPERIPSQTISITHY